MSDTFIFEAQTQAQWLVLATAQLKTDAQSLMAQELASDLQAPAFISAAEVAGSPFSMPELPVPDSMPLCFTFLKLTNNDLKAGQQTFKYVKTLDSQGIFVEGAYMPELIGDIHQNIDLRQTNLFLDIQPDNLGDYAHLLNRQFASVSAFQIQISSDPLAEAALSGQNIDASKYDFIAGFASKFYTSNHIICPFLKTSIYAWAGASPIQQIAFTLAHLAETIDYLDKSNFGADKFWNKVGISLEVGHQYMVEIAKIRALRLLVLQMGVQAYKIAKPNVKLFARTSKRWFTTENPENNLSRHTIGAMAAYLGGADMLAVEPHIADAHKPTHLRYALNIGRLLSYEAHLDQARQAPTGSYYLDFLSRNIAQKAWDLFIQIQNMGGLSAALTNGFVQKNIAQEQKWILEQLMQNKISISGQKLNKDKVSDKLMALNTQNLPLGLEAFRLLDYLD